MLDALISNLRCRGDVLLRSESTSHSQGAPVNGSAGKELPAPAPCLFTETHVVEDPQEMLHHRQPREETTTRLFFPGQDIAVEPPKKPGLGLTGI